MDKEKLLEKLNSLFKEELWGRLDPKDIGISKFRILDDLFNNIVSQGLVEDTREICYKHLDEHGDSVTAQYLTGLLGYHTDTMEDKIQLRKLIDLYMRYHKWAVVEVLSEKVLEYGENSVALKALATSLERLGRSREAIPVWEDLLKIDRFDADVAKKLAFAIIDDDPEKSIQYMKLSIEGFIKNGEYDEISELWNKLVAVSWEDIQFFERIERMLVDARQEELAASLLKTLLHKYKDEENPEQSIELLKKILEYTPEDNAARRDLIKLYEKKYGEHSQYEQFLKLSKLNNFRHPVKHAIEDFENSIIFDKGNYAYHRSWGVGKISDIDADSIVINFSDKPDHRMSIQMALQALMPLPSDHLYVRQYEDPEGLKKMFKEDFMNFFEILIRSYGGEITLAQIKKELIPDYVSQKSWSKWWNKKRTEIRKDPLFGISPSKKDLIFMRDKPITFADELLDSFIKADSFSSKLDIALEFVNNIDEKEGEPVAHFFIDYFLDNLKGDSATKLILSYFILQGFTRYIDAKKLKLDTAYKNVIQFIKDNDDLTAISRKIGSYDYKKDFVNLIEESREDWPQVVYEILFETPVRIHRYIINNLIRAQEFGVINQFIERAVTGVKQYPEIFLWVSRNLLTRAWDYDWLDYSRQELILTHFRLLNELKKIETRGNRLKNMVIDILFDNEEAVLRDIIKNNDVSFIRKIYDLFTGVPYVEESQVEKFYDLIIQEYPDFKALPQGEGDEEISLDTEKLIVTQEGFDRKQEELNNMVNVELANLTKELAKVSDVSGDVRENVEYNTLMEKQTILKMSINKLENEIKKAEILDFNSVSTDKVDIGTTVRVKNLDDGTEDKFTILGPWDADFERKILSYRSPIAQELLGKKENEEINIKIGDEVRKLKMISIEKYK